MSDILITEQIEGTAIEDLRRSFHVAYEPDLWESPEKLKHRVGDFQALIVRNQTSVSADVIKAGQKLKVIGRAGAGVDNIDVGTASEAGVAVVYAPAQNSIAVAELTIALMLALARQVSAADRDTKAGGWHRHRFTGTELFGKTLGIVGLGRIGFLTAKRAQAFETNLFAYDPYLDPHAAAILESGARLMGLDDLLARADFVSCHVPDNDQTRGLFSYERFCQMKPTAFFINTSRGGVVQETGLIRALEEKRLAGAALDVRQTEPPSRDALCQMDNVILTPHIAAFTGEAQARVIAEVCRDVRAVLEGQAAKNYVNFPCFKGR